MLIICLIFLSVVSTIPRRYNYNCFNMLAEIFPVKKIPCNYGNRTFQIRGKSYDELQPKIPGYTQKVMETQLEVANSIPTSKGDALAKYIEFRKLLFARDKQDEFTQSSEDEFVDRMKLLQYYRTLGDMVKDAYQILYDADPIGWLDNEYTLYKNVYSGIYSNYVLQSRLRPKKSTSSTDYCKNLAHSLKNDRDWGNGSAKNAHELIFRCYDIFPYNDDAAKKIFDLSLLMIEFYVFSNYSSNGVGASLAYKTLKQQELNFDSSLHFHDFFERVISRLYDAHISYKVDCYEQFTFVQPLYIQHLSDHNHVPGLYITKANTLELQEWVNARVFKIDAYGAYSKVFNYGSQIGKCHNANTRYNLGVSRLLFESSSQDFRLERGLFLKRTTIPERSYLIYSLIKPGSNQVVDIKVDWMVFKNPTLAEFSDQYTYWNKNCETKHLKRIIKTSTTSLQRRSSGALKPFAKDNVIKKYSRMKKRGNVATYTATIDGTIPEAIGPGFAFFILNDPKYGDYGVLVIATFDVTDASGWFKNMKLGFTTLMDKGITRLLLDLTGNSGGTLCLAYTLLGVLSPSHIFPFPATEFTYGTRVVPTDSLIRIATCADEAKIEVSPFKLKCFTDLATRADFPDGYNWGTNSEVKPKVLNGLMYGYSRFSSFLMDKCELKSTPILADVKPNFAKIILVSDGLCGSSCAIVAAYLQQHGSPAILISAKDINYKPGTLFSFAGGQVVNFNNIKDVARRSSCFDMLPDVLESVQLTITYRAIFNMDDQRNPLEYYRLLAQYAYEYSLQYASSFAQRWKDFFQRGMDIVEHPEDYKDDISESGQVFPFSS